MGRRATTTFSSDFYCTSCGKRTMSLARKDNKKREQGHLKKLYCLNCKEEKNCVEIRVGNSYTYDIFKYEFDGGNFTKEGTRKMTYKQFLAERN